MNNPVACTLLSFGVIALSAIAVGAGAKADPAAQPGNSSGPIIIIAEDIEGEALAQRHLIPRPGFGAGSKRFLFQGQTESYRPVRRQQGRIRLDAD